MRPRLALQYCWSTTQEAENGADGQRAIDLVTA
jgi:hypothetical protein